MSEPIPLQNFINILGRRWLLFSLFSILVGLTLTFGVDVFSPRYQYVSQLEVGSKFSDSGLELIVDPNQLRMEVSAISRNILASSLMDKSNRPGLGILLRRDIPSVAGSIESHDKTILSLKSSGTEKEQNIYAELHSRLLEAIVKKHDEIIKDEKSLLLEKQQKFREAYLDKEQERLILQDRLPRAQSDLVLLTSLVNAYNKSIERLHSLGNEISGANYVEREISAYFDDEVSVSVDEVLAISSAASRRVEAVTKLTSLHTQLSQARRDYENKLKALKKEIIFIQDKLSTSLVPLKYDDQFVALQEQLSKLQPSRVVGAIAKKTVQDKIDSEIMVPRIVGVIMIALMGGGFAIFLVELIARRRNSRAEDASS